MAQYISKAALVAEIERLIDSHKPLKTLDPTYCEGLDDSLDDVLSFLDTLEIKDEVVLTDPIKAMTEALRIEYEKGRADVINKACEFLKDIFEEYENLTDYNPTEDFKNYMNRHES